MKPNFFRDKIAQLLGRSVRRVGLVAGGILDASFVILNTFGVISISWIPFLIVSASMPILIYCFGYRIGVWISRRGYKTEAEAKTAIEGYIEVVTGFSK